MKTFVRTILLSVTLVFSFAFAKAANVDLKAGDSVTLGTSTVSCEAAELPTCSYIAGNVYCGNECKYIAGNVYCASEAGGECKYIAGNVYCGVGCDYIAGNVYCARGGRATPAVPAKP